MVLHLRFCQRSLHHQRLWRAVGRRHGGTHAVLVDGNAPQRRLGGQCQWLPPSPRQLQNAAYVEFILTYFNSFCILFKEACVFLLLVSNLPKNVENAEGLEPCHAHPAGGRASQRLSLLHGRSHLLRHQKWRIGLVGKASKQTTSICDKNIKFPVGVLFFVLFWLSLFLWLFHTVPLFAPFILAKHVERHDSEEMTCAVC